MDTGDVVLLGGLVVVGFIAYKLIGTSSPAPAVGAAGGGAASQQGLHEAHPEYAALGLQGGKALATGNYIGAAQAVIAIQSDPKVRTAEWNATKSAISFGASQAVSGAKSVLHTVTFGLV